LSAALWRLFSGLGRLFLGLKPERSYKRQSWFAPF
jgi:hypothetical protein